MQKIYLFIDINAPVQTVWDTMLSDATYREWTKEFHEGSYFEGSWEQGQKIRFLGPDENGKLGGMSSEIAENRPYEFISIHHLAIIQDGIEDSTSELAKQWTGGFENYTFAEKDGVTTLTVDMDIDEKGKESMESYWKKGLEKLKELAEK